MVRSSQVTVGKRRGVYLRQAHETSGVSTHGVTVTPRFHEATAPEAKQLLELHLDLSSSAPGWLSAPSRLHMCHAGRGFSVVVDPTGLRPGLHSATVRAALRGAPAGSGWLFEVPVTVIKPVAVSGLPTVELGLACEVGSLHRRFFTPPHGATWADITVRDKRSGDAAAKDGAAHLMAVHAVQLLPHVPFRDREAKAFVQLRPGASRTLSLALDPDLTVEVTLAQYWSTASHDKQPVDLVIDFRGVLPSPSALALGIAGPSRLDLSAPLRDEELSPSASLTAWRRALHPTKHDISPCGDRDVLPGGKRLFQLVLEYAFDAAEDGEVTFRAPLLNGLLYEAEFDSQFFLVFDKQKKRVGFGDAWPDPTKLKKGAHTVKYQVKHDDMKKLAALKDMMVVAERKLKDPVAVPCFADAGQASCGGTGAGSFVLAKGAATSVCFGEPPREKLPAGVAAGDELVGALSCVKKALDRSRPKGWPVSYVVPPAPPKAAEPAAAAAAAAPAADKGAAEESETQKLEKQVLELKVKALAAYDAATPPKDAAWDELFAALVAAGAGDHLPLLVASLHHADRAQGTDRDAAAVVAAADAVVAAVLPAELSGALGLRAAEGEEGVRKALDDRKTALVDALNRKARALVGSDAFAPAFAELQRWEDAKAPGGAKAFATVALAAHGADGAGATLKYCKAALEKELGDKVEAEVRAARARCLEALGWGWLAEHEKVWERLNKPKAFALF